MTRIERIDSMYETARHLLLDLAMPPKGWGAMRTVGYRANGLYKQFQNEGEFPLTENFEVLEKTKSGKFLIWLFEEAQYFDFSGIYFEQETGRTTTGVQMEFIRKHIANFAIDSFEWLIKEKEKTS